MTTVRLNQRDADAICSTIQTGHKFVASALTGYRESNFGVPHLANRYIIKSYDEVIAVINLDDETAIFTTKKFSQTTTRHQGAVNAVLECLGVAATATDKRLDPYGGEW